MCRLFYICIFFFSKYISSAQENIVPNAGFEIYVDQPDRWYYNGKHFTEIVKYWSSPTPASPDAYGPKILVPKDWRKKGFGDLDPHSGERMVGITIYGCEKGKPHCREYIQVQLAEPLIPGQEYEISWWVAHLQGSCFSNNMGVAFSLEELHHDLDEKLDATAQINLDYLLKPSMNQWIPVSATFVPGFAYEYLTLGNFYSDKKTNIEKPAGALYNYAYYYIDDMLIRKKEPILPKPPVKDHLAERKLEIGNKILLNNIYFDYDSADFLPRSYEQLNILLEILERNPNLAIEIHGHTDNTGNDEYNIDLSRQRAKAVVDYLIQNKIDPGRLNYKGFGSSLPIDSNESYLGRKKNRRVEFLIVNY